MVKNNSVREFSNTKKNKKDIKVLKRNAFEKMYDERTVLEQVSI